MISKVLRKPGRLFWLLCGLVALGGVGVILAATTPDREDVLTRVLMRSLDANHFAAPKMDDAFGAKVFTQYMKRLDPQKRFFLLADIQALQEQESEIDDQLKKGRYDLCESANELLQSRVKEVQGLVAEILSQPMDFDASDSLMVQNDKMPWCKSKEELKERWVQLLKYQVLTRLDNANEKTEKALKEQQDSTKVKKGKSAAKGRPEASAKGHGIPSGNGRLAVADEKAARDYVARNVARVFKRMSKDEKLDRVAGYLNTVSTVYDPHTEYFKPEVKEEFDLNMTGRLEGIGAVLKEEDGFIKVVSIVPGSASWRQKDLKAEDKIIKVAQADGEPVDLIDASVTEAVKLIRGKKGTEVRLTVEKPDGQIKVIRIIRDIVIVEETYAKAAVLVDSISKSRIGYIDLPAFYHDFSNPKGRSSSTDLAKEIERLKSAKVHGIVLDLRNNGGGALDDAVKMAGLFFKEGPVVQVRDGRDQINALRDKNKSVEWDGPLVVMINGFSASASEIVSAALQDYQRAVVVGTDTSFGKGTVQTLMDLDGFLPPSYEEIKPIGTLKLTIQKFYRVNGGSTQFRGVVPDILIPDAYSQLEVGEKNLDYPLAYDSVKALEVEKGPLDKAKIDQLRQKAQLRLSSDARAKQYLEMQAKMETVRRREYVPLKRSDFFAEQEMTRKVSEAQDSVSKSINKVLVEPVDEKAGWEKDSVAVEKVKRWSEQIQNDFYLRETIQVMKDLVGVATKTVK
jgi:carboxyl-terminal processing protease